jgi:hypothetical protein
MFAPTDIPVMPNPTTAPALAMHSGTSASTPFMAGVAAMMKAIHPSLAATDIDLLIDETAWTGSPDVNVPRWVNAFRAVSAAADDRMPPDSFEPNDTPSAAASLAPGDYPSLSIEAAGAVDGYRVHLDDYASLDVFIRFMADLGDVTFDVVREGGGPIGVSGVHVASTRNDRSYHAELVPPGDYRIDVHGEAPNAYDLSVVTGPASLSPDAFEVDDSFATAASPAWGSYAVTLHLPTDVDFYAFVAPPLTSKLVRGYEFRIDASDRPLTATLLDATGAVVASGADAIAVPPGGTYVARIAGPRTRYNFTFAAKVDPAIFPNFTPALPPDLTFVNPGDPPAPGIVVDGPVWYVFERGPSVDGFQVDGPNVHVTLFDGNGALVAEGSSVATGREIAWLANVVAQGPLLARVSRTDLGGADASAMPSFAASLHAP